MSRNLALSGKSARSADLVRRAAHAALLSFEKAPIAADLLVERFSSKGFDARDRAFLRELVYGVLRWRSRLDFVSAHFLNKPNVAPPVREALRLGTYQLLFMDRVPAHSAVDGAVSLLNRPNLGWAKGLVNAVLRKVAEGEVAPPENIEDYLTLWESHPRWLVKRWIRNLGEEEALRRCRANNEEAPVVLRVNTQASSARSLMTELASEGVEARPGRVDPDCLLYLPDESAPGARFSDTAAWREGRFIVMDESSSLVSRFAGASLEREFSMPARPPAEKRLASCGRRERMEASFRENLPLAASLFSSVIVLGFGRMRGSCGWMRQSRLFRIYSTSFSWMRLAADWVFSGGIPMRDGG